ncbi:MAG TPA: MFS transporter [Thermomicrobiales bacterium]|nr:MFS transporter [Thermomicrobiales bacterium]
MTRNNNRPGSLWQHRDFLKLWGAQSVTQVGTQISLLAIPLVAAITLDASAGQMGLLAAAGTSPFLFFGLIAGVVTDRMRRRPILVWTDLGRAALMTLVPLAWWLDALTFTLLISVAFAVGVLNVFFEVSYQSYLPSVVRRDQLVEGNSKLETSRAGAQIAGPGLAGGLIQVVGAPVALVLDAVSFLISGILLGLIRAPEPPVAQSESRNSIVAEMREGVTYILRSPLLRPIAGCTGTANFFGGMSVAVIVLFATRELGLYAGWLGAIFAGGSVGFLVGALLAGRAAARLGVGQAIVLGIAISGIGGLVLPLAGGAPLASAAILMAGIAITGVGGAIYNITQVSLRQTITPDRMLGRLNATMRFLVWGTLPLGNLAGGFTGGLIGLRGTLVLAGCGSLLATLWPLLSAVRSLDSYPSEPLPEPGAAPIQAD